MTWYEKNPELFETEKITMKKSFPSFELGKLDDGRLYWVGEVTPGVYQTKLGCFKTYNLMAIYENYHSHDCTQISSSIKVYPIIPDMRDIRDELLKKTGKDISSYISRMSSDSELYFISPHDNDSTFSSYKLCASAILGVQSLLLALELVLTDQIDIDVVINAYKQHLISNNNESSAY